MAAFFQWYAIFLLKINLQLNQEGFKDSYNIMCDAGWAQCRIAGSCRARLALQRKNDWKRSHSRSSNCRASQRGHILVWEIWYFLAARPVWVCDWHWDIITLSIWEHLGQYSKSDRIISRLVLLWPAPLPLFYLQITSSGLWKQSHNKLW